MARRNTFDPAAMMMLGFEFSRMMAEAQAVIAMRMWGMAGMWGIGPDEENLMVREKQLAWSRAGMSMWRAALAGRPAEAVLRAGIRPIRSKTSGNLRRLSRKGPRVPTGR